MVASQAIGDDFAPGRAVCRIEGGIQRHFREAGGSAATAFGRSAVSGGLSGTLGEFNGVRPRDGRVSSWLPEGFELIIAGTGPLEARGAAAGRTESQGRVQGVHGSPRMSSTCIAGGSADQCRLTKSINTRHFYPSKMMEFMASGTATLSTCTGHTEEEFGEFVYLLREETPQALADLVRQIAAACRRASQTWAAEPGIHLVEQDLGASG